MNDLEYDDVTAHSINMKQRDMFKWRVKHKD